MDNSNSIKYVIKFNNGMFLQRDPVLNTNKPLVTASDITNSRMWVQEGRLTTWARNHKKMLDDIDPWWQIKKVKITYEEKEY